MPQHFCICVFVCAVPSAPRPPLAIVQTNIPTNRNPLTSSRSYCLVHNERMSIIFIQQFIVYGFTQIIVYYHWALVENVVCVCVPDSAMKMVGWMLFMLMFCCLLGGESWKHTTNSRFSPGSSSTLAINGTSESLQEESRGEAAAAVCCSIRRWCWCCRCWWLSTNYRRRWSILHRQLELAC